MYNYSQLFRKIGIQHAITSFVERFQFVSKQPNFDLNLSVVILKSLYYHLRFKKIFAANNTSILGLNNITTYDPMFIGTNRVDFLNHHDRTFLNVEGNLIIKGETYIGRGCRIAIHRGATCIINRCSFTGLTNLIIDHYLEIGSGCQISWGCEFLDEDWHKISYKDHQEKEPGIYIGDHVWIGSNVKILKGLRIANNSVIAANSVVTKSFLEENVLIAGHPARVIRQDVSWQ